MKRYITAFILALGVTFVLGMKTSSQAVNFADSNDLLMAARFMGLAHPPGYPLLVVLLALISRLFGAFSIAIVAGWTMAALMGSATGLLFLILGDIGRTKQDSFVFDVYALITSLLWLTIPLNWVLGTVPEVMPFGIVLILLSVFCYGKKQFFGTGFFSVLALLHHPLLGLITAGIWYLSLVSVSFRVKRFVQMGSGAVMAFLLVIAAYSILTHNASTYSWDVPRSLVGWWQMFNRQTYTESGSAIEMFNRGAGLSLSISSVVLWMRWWLTNQWGWLLGLFCLLGMGSLVHFRQWKWLVMGAFGLLLYGPGVALYVKHPAVMGLAETAVWWGSALRERMFYVFFLIFPFFVFAGIRMLGLIPQRYKWLRYGVLSVLVILCGWRIYGQYCQGSMDTGANASAVYSQQILSSLPKRSVMITQTDEVFNFLYTQLVLGIRQDVSIVPVGMILEPVKWQESHLATNGFTDNQQEFVADIVTTGLHQQRPVYLYAMDASILSYLGLEGDPFYGVPDGLLLRVQQEPPTELPSADFGVSVQLAPIKTLVTDNWFKGFRAHLAALHTQQTYYLARLGFNEQAYWNANMAKSLFYKPASMKVVDSTLQVGVERFKSEKSFWRYRRLSLEEWQQRADQARKEGKYDEETYFSSRTQLVRAALGR